MLVCACRLKAAVLEAGTSLTPSYWQSRPGGAPLRSPATGVEHESDSENEPTITSPSGRLQSGGIASSSPAVSNQTRTMFRISPSSKSPQSSFRLRNMRKSSGHFAEDSISLSNRSDSSDHQHHLVDDPPLAPARRQPSRQLSESLIPIPPAVPRSAGRTRSPQRVAPAPGSCTQPDNMQTHVKPNTVHTQQHCHVQCLLSSASVCKFAAYHTTLRVTLA